MKHPLKDLDPDLYAAVELLIATASPPSQGPTEDEAAFDRVDELLRERPGRAGPLVLLLSYKLHEQMVEVFEKHFEGSDEGPHSQVILSWPIVEEASDALQMATDLVAMCRDDLPRGRVVALNAVLQVGFHAQPDRYIRLLNCLVCLAAALRFGTLDLGPALSREATS